jgi:hypothetical protein
MPSRRARPTAISRPRRSRSSRRFCGRSTTPNQGSASPATRRSPRLPIAPGRRSPRRSRRSRRPGSSHGCSGSNGCGSDALISWGTTAGAGGLSGPRTPTASTIHRPIDPQAANLLSLKRRREPLIKSLPCCPRLRIIARRPSSALKEASGEAPRSPTARNRGPPGAGSSGGRATDRAARKGRRRAACAPSTAFTQSNAPSGSKGRQRAAVRRPRLLQGRSASPSSASRCETYVIPNEVSGRTRH